MRRALTAAAALSALVLASTAAPANADTLLSATPTTIAGATLDGLPATPASPPGVSPEVYYDDATGTYYLWTTHMPAVMYSSTDGTSWSPVAGATVPNGFDWSIVKMGPNKVVEGKRLGDTDLRKQHGVTVMAVQRGDAEWCNADADTVIEPGDTILIAGPIKKAEAFGQLR